MNSLMSMRTMWSSLSNKKPASALHNSVLPTPVGPRNRKLPLGRCGSDRPERERRMAVATAAVASSRAPTRWGGPGGGGDGLSRPHRTGGGGACHLRVVVFLALHHLGHGEAGGAADHLGD